MRKNSKRVHENSLSKVLINQNDQVLPISRFINILKLIVSDGNDNGK